MKKSFLLIIIVCFFYFPLHSQVIEKKRDGNTINHTIRLKNGKNGIFRMINYNNDKKPVIMQAGDPQRSFIPERKYPGSHHPLTTHHVVFHFDNFCEDILLNGTDTLFRTYLNLTRINNTTVEGDVTDGYYYLFTWMLGNHTHYNIFRKGFHVYKDMDTTILSSSATYQVNQQFFDENGNILNDYYRNGDQSGFIVEFPSQFKSLYYSLTESAEGPATIKFSEVSPDTKLSFSKTHVPLGAPYPLYNYYIVVYPTLAGINQATTLSMSPSEYRYFRFIYHPTPAFNKSYYAWANGTIANDSLLGYADTFIGAWEDKKYPGTGQDTIHVFINGSASDSNIRNFGAGVVHLESDPATSLNELFGPLFYMNNQNELVLTCNGNFPPVKGDYHVLSGSKVHVGNSAPFHRSYNYNISGIEEINLYQHFRDQTGARRNIDLTWSTYDIWKGNLKLFHDTIRDYHIDYWTPGPDIYSLIVNDSNYSMLGKPGYLKGDMTFDLRLPDPNPPALIAFKVLMCDSLQPELIHGYPSKVEFTAGDYSMLPPDYRPVYHSLASASLQYKAYDDTAWYDLNVIPEPALLDSLCGMPYHADLQPVFNQFPDSAWVDLKISITDSSGNYNTQTMHPAFLVRNALTGLPSGKANPVLFLYPNPSTGKIWIVTECRWTSLRILSYAGQCVLKLPFTPELDISSLKPGIYILEIFNNQSGEKACLKLIKI